MTGFAARAHEKTESLKLIKQIFDLADADCSGYLDAREIAELLAFGDEEDPDGIALACFVAVLSGQWNY